MSDFRAFLISRKQQFLLTPFLSLFTLQIPLKVKVKVAQLCPALCDPMDYSPWNSLGQNTGVGSLSLLQGVFPTQGLYPGLPHCRLILYQLSHPTNTPKTSNNAVIPLGMHATMLSSTKRWNTKFFIPYSSQTTQ